eukprot:2434616-Heterocapsa_arctica.AAC.1
MARGSAAARRPCSGPAAQRRWGGLAARWRPIGPVEAAAAQPKPHRLPATASAQEPGRSDRDLRSRRTPPPGWP